MEYVIIGAGGTGGILGAALYNAGFPVTLIARGEHLENIRKDGLIIKSMTDHIESVYHVPACTAEEYTGSADVVFVCVKGYSVPAVLPFIERISTPDTVIIPLLNIFTTGETLRKSLPGRYVLDGCIYVSANIESPGRLLHHSRILKVVYGAAAGQEKRGELEIIRKEMTDAGIAAVLSDDIRRDALKKFCYVSPIGAAGLYYHVTAGAFQKEGPERELYIGMMREIEALAKAMGSPFDEDVIEKNLEILSKQPPEADTSLQRDVIAGRPSEIEGLVYKVPELGASLGLEMPLYTMVAERLRQRERYNESR